jgi:vacuolar-type H+-ATPase subunit H
MPDIIFYGHNPQANIPENLLNSLLKGGEILSLEDIKAVAETEKKAAEIRSKALDEAKQIISDAGKRGRAYAEKACAEAEDEAGRLLGEAERTAEELNLKSRSAAEKYCAALESSASARLDEAAGKIAERIVNA